MLLAGLTGGIATGKNSVALILKDLGAKIIDADLLSRKLVERGMPAWQAIRDSFGSAVIKADGSLNRKALGEIVFADDEKRELLNSILHPEIIEEERRRIDLIEKDAPRSIVIVNAALLIESGNYREMDKVIVLSADEDIILERLAVRDGLSPDESRLRIKAQSSISEKLKHADFVLENNGTREELKEKVVMLYGELKAMEQADLKKK
ncbi:MAG: dephospho-CoA kinase [bacterium]|nr:dephospho-CoA kinase [bacterium]